MEIFLTLISTLEKLIGFKLLCTAQVLKAMLSFILIFKQFLVFSSHLLSTQITRLSVKI